VNDRTMLGDRSPAGQCACACACSAGDERSSSGAWRVSERSPKEVRSFASSVCLALFWKTYANVCSVC
jgi:hypothetical protein